MFGYKIRIDQYCNHSEREEEQWGSWSESYTNSLDSYARPTKKYPDVVTLHKFEAEDDAFVVWVEWSDGDSFGHASGNGTEVIGIFKSAAVAYELEKHIEEQYRNKKENIDITTSDGQTFKMNHAPWVGFFESLDCVNVDRVTILRA